MSASFYKRHISVTLLRIDVASVTLPSLFLPFFLFATRNGGSAVGRGHPDYAPLSCHAPERPARRDAALREDSAGAHAHHMFVRSPLDIQLDNTCAGPPRAAEGRGLGVLRREGGRPSRRRRWMCTSTKSISFSRLIRPRSRSVEPTTLRRARGARGKGGEEGSCSED